MKLTRIAKIGAIGAIAALALSACAANEAGGTPADPSAPAGLSGELAGSGASSQEVAVQTWTAGFQGANPDVTINYDPAGSGAGRESFQAGAVAFAGSDRAFKIEELEAGPFDGCVADTNIIELPTYISPIAVIFNLEGVDELNLDAATIAGPVRRHHHELERPGHRGAERGRRSSRSGRDAGAPRRRLGHDRELHRLPVRDRAGRLDLRARRRVAALRAARPPRAPRASSRPSPVATGPSATPTRRAPPRRDSRPLRSRSATSSSRTRPRPPPPSSTLRRSKRAAPRATSPSSWTAPRKRPASTRSSSSAT